MPAGLVEAVRAASERRAPLLVAFDGPSGTGKSTAAAAVAAALDATVVDGDDFYAGGTIAEWSSWTPEERAARCIDWRRLRAEALEPLLAGRTAMWRRFDWEVMSGLADEPVHRPPRPIVILDGVYSARPELRDLVDLAVLVEAADDRVRRRRLVAREGEAFMAAWHALWDEAEDHYCGQVRPRASFDLVVVTE